MKGSFLLGKKFVGLMVFLVLAGCSLGPEMEEGKWEISSEMGMKGVPFKMPAISSSRCLTKKDSIPWQAEEPGCSLVSQEVQENTVRWVSVCTESGSEVKSEGQITYAGVVFSGTVDISYSSGPVSMTATNTITGKYLGPCQ